MKARHISKRAAVILDRLRSHRHVASTNEFAVEYMVRPRILPFVVRSRARRCAKSGGSRGR
jgi:hypothetical protein